jgi:hypothetical protein
MLGRLYELGFEGFDPLFQRCPFGGVGDLFQ